MRKEILDEFENCRLKILKLILKKLRSCEKQTIFLNERRYFRISESEENVITQIYRSIYIVDEKLMVNYDYGDGFEPFEFENVSEELEFLSANEIYEIVCRIPE